MKRRDDALSVGNGPGSGGSGGANDDIYGGGVYPGILPAVPGADAGPVIPDKDRRTNAATAASAAGVRALSAQALQFYFRAPVKAFFRTRVDYLAYARGPDWSLGTAPTASSPSSSPSPLSYHRLRTWLRGTTPGVLTLAIKRYGWSVVPDQVLPPLMANIGVAAVLYTSYLQILGQLHPESRQARQRVYPPPAPTETFVAGFLAGGIQSLVAAPLDAIQARYDHREVAAAAGKLHGGSGSGSSSGAPPSMWTFSAAKLREIGLRGIFAGWGLSFVKDSVGCAVFFSVFEYVKAQCYYRFVAHYYGALDGSAVLARVMQQETAARRRQQQRLGAGGGRDSSSSNSSSSSSSTHEHHHHLHHHHDGRDSFSSPTPPASASLAALCSVAASMPIVVRPHYALEPSFLLLAGISASLAQQILLHPLTHFQVVHWDMLEDLDAAAKEAAARAAAWSKTRANRGTSATGSRPGQPSAAASEPVRLPRFHFMRTYYHAYLKTSKRCSDLAAAEGRSLVSWLYRGFWWNAIRQVPSTSAGLIIFELLRRKSGMAGDGVRIRQDGYDILVA